MHQDRRPTVAVLGMGAMGAPMAANLARAGFEVAAWNRSPDRAERAAAEHGLRAAELPSEATAGADVVITMLSDAAAVQEVMADDGALQAMDDEALWLQMSTVGLAGTEALAALAAERGVAFVDAPVLGTRQPAEAGELLVLASGPDEVRPRCEPVFAAVGRRTLWLGPAGTGTRLKLVLNAWLLALVGGLGETVALARALAIDPQDVLATIAGGPLDLPYAQLKGRMMIEGEFPPAFRLALAGKDAGLALEAAERHGLELPVLRAVREELHRAEQLGHGDEDMAAVVRAVEPA
jgi:3-hydroxyisobutyrate dehydrogenase